MKKDLDNMESTSAPKDTGYVVYISFFVLGVGVLFPWNAFITAATYFGSRFCGTSHESSFEDDVGSAYMAANLAVLIMVVRYQNLFTRKFRVLGSFVCWFILFVGVTAMVLFKDIPIWLVYWFTLLACVLCGVFSAICSGGIFGMVAQFPPIYMQAVMSGQGVSGLTAALVSMGAALVGKDDDSCSDDDDDGSDVVDDGDDQDCSDYDEVDYGSFSYFLVACVIFFFCIFSYIILERAPFARYYDQEQIEGDDDDTPKASSSSKPSGHNEVSTSYSPLNESLVGDNEREPNAHSSLNNDAFADPYDAQHISSEKSGEAEGGGHHVPTLADYYRVLSVIKSDVFSVWFVFTVTIGLFPGVSSMIRPAVLKNCGDGVFSKATFTALFFVFFNLFDLFGRSSAGFIQLVSKEKLPFAAACRIIFIPLFCLCNVNGTRLEVLFKFTYWPLLFMALMAFSNGYFSTLAMIYGPSRVEHHDSEIAGSIMILALTAGLFSGSMLAYLVTFIVLG